jgi:hypothetical protein
MDQSLSYDRLIEEVRRVYQQHGPTAATEIEVFLEQYLEGFSAEDRIAITEELGKRLSGGGKSGAVDGNDEEVLSRVCSLLLGRKVSRVELSSSELLERLADSLNTIFDSLNQLIAVINTTLATGQPGEETIRQVIGGHLEDADQKESLQTYLGQIREAFLVTHKAFKKAAYDQVAQILSELDPEQISSAGSGGFRFGALRKADFFETYEQKYRQVKQWFDSGRFMEALLREFEKNSQRLST